MDGNSAKGQRKPSKNLSARQPDIPACSPVHDIKFVFADTFPDYLANSRIRKAFRSPIIFGMDFVLSASIRSF
jgi:hypothetical protein